MMGRIAEKTEVYLRSEDHVARVDLTRTLRRVTTAVAHGANLLARELEAKLVAVWTQTGNTARLLSKTRLNVPVVGLSADPAICRRMSMYYGVVPLQMVWQEDDSSMLRALDDLLLERNLVKQGDLIVVIAGTRLEKEGATNSLLMHLVGSSKKR